MSIKDLEPGEYSAKLLSASMEMNERLSAPEIQMVFQIDAPPFGEQRVYSNQLYFTKAGEKSKKAQLFLKAIEVMGEDKDLGTDAASYNKDKEYKITIGDNQKGYREILWVNDASARKENSGGFGGQSNRAGVEAFFANKKSGSASAGPSGFDSDDKIPF